MSIRVVDRVDGWDQRPFDGGYGALHDLADEEFSGVVRAGGAEAYLTMGTVVAVRHGAIEDFEAASGTVHVAPAPALPLLAVMQEEDVDVRAQYYSEETPISEVDGTLSSGGFTGYVELSENVLSGDYFLVYHGGNSMSVAYVGNNDKLITDDEAFQTADDEVGIYKVRQVDVEPIEIPEPTATEETAAEAAAAAATAEGAAEAEPSPDAEADDGGDPETADEAETPDDAETGEDAESDDARAAADAEDASGATDVETSSGESATDDDRASDASADAAAADPADDRTVDDAERTRSTADSTPSSSEEPAGETAASTPNRTTADSSAGGTAADRTSREGSEATAPSTDSRPPAEPDSGAATSEHATDPGGQPQSPPPSGAETVGGGAGRRDGRSASGGQARPQAGTDHGAAGQSTGRGAVDLETRSIPSLDPSHTQAPQRESRSEPTPEPTPQPRETASTPQRQGGGDRRQRADPDPEPDPQRRGQAADSPAQPEAESAEDDGGADEEALAELEAELDDREAELDRLESELEAAERDREDLEADLAAVREERDELADEVERLESELERLEQEFGAATDAEARMTPSEAIEGTNLFVEYERKGNATLADGHEGTEGREAVAENLRLGVHTEFDEAAVAVGGQDFDEWLGQTLHYRFAQWVVADLLFEIRDTGHADDLPDLYDAIREVRRVEFNGVVDVEYVEDGQDKSGRERFDVIFRHRMGDPLLVANLNDSREPATGNMMESLVTSAERVGQTEDALASAFLVTSSFFESEALETVSEATKGGLLSRDSRKSFVNLSRKAGYHLCLVAARDGNFHMEVPEL